MRKKFSFCLAVVLIPFLSTNVHAERWICDLKSIYWHDPTKMEYKLDTKYWIAGKHFTSFEVDLVGSQVRHLDYSKNWLSRKKITPWSNDVLIELYSEHGVGHIITLFHPNAVDQENKMRRYAWLSLVTWNIELGFCKKR
jgi:hypothetical protein